MRADPFMPRDLLARKAARDEPQDLDLPIGEREVDARSFQKDAARDRPAGEGAQAEQDGSAQVHTPGSGRRLRALSSAARPLGVSSRA